MVSTLDIDIDAVSALMRAVSQAEILPRFRKLDDAHSWEKRPGSIVTVADEAAEAALEEGLRAILPGSAVVGEEAVEQTPSILDALNEPGPVWIVDPIDGTANFADGKECFVVIIALAIDGETEAGWIYDPNADSIAHARRGAGAWRDGEPMRVPHPIPDAEMSGAYGWRLRKDKAFDGRFKRSTYRRCCGADYLALGAGETHFAFYRSLKPWDHAAGQLIHSEAGGYNACVDGTAYRPGRKKQEGLLLAPARETWTSLADDIRRALKI